MQNLKKNYQTRYLILVASILLTFGFAELGLRVGVLKTRIYQRLQPQGAVNAQRKIVVVGDSFIYKGGELDQMLSSKLNQDKVQILNLATGGSGPQEYRSELKIFGIKYKPDLIMLGYYVGNDVANVQVKMQFDVGFKSALRPVWRSFYIYHLFNDAWMIWCQQRADAKYSRIVAGALSDPNNFNKQLLLQGNETLAAWNKTKTILADVNAISQSIQAKLVIVIFPEALQVSRSHEEFYKRAGYNIDPRVFDSTKPQDLLMEFCREQKIDCLDLLPPFRQATTELYFETDIHLAESGNALAADLISKFVESRMQST